LGLGGLGGLGGVEFRLVIGSGFREKSKVLITATIVFTPGSRSKKDDWSEGGMNSAESIRCRLKSIDFMHGEIQVVYTTMLNNVEFFFIRAF
jgi:hypothetical protein